MLIARGQFTLYETTDGYSARVDPPVWQVLCDAAGTPQPGELGSGGRAAFTVSASRGDRPLQMVRSSQPATEGRCHWRALSAAGCAVGATGDTQFYLTAISADQAAVALSFDFEGRETQTRTLQVTKQRRGADGEDGEPAQYVYFFSGYRVAPGVEISLTGGANLAAQRRGFNCVTLDRQTLARREYRWFDTYSDRTGANVVENMKAWLDSIDDTVFLCIATYEWVNWNPTTGDDLYAALREFGLQLLQDMRTGYLPFCFMGYRGLAAGYAAVAQWPPTEVGNAQSVMEMVVYTAGGVIATSRPGAPGPQGVPGPAGKDGQQYYTWIRYADTADGAGLTNDPAGKAYIGLAYNKTTPTESANPADYSWSLIKGADGRPGTDGKDGLQGPKGEDGQQYYTWIKYADTSSGAGMYDTPTAATRYIGISVNRTTAAESTNPSDYTWSLFRGADGADGERAHYIYLRGVHFEQLNGENGKYPVTEPLVAVDGENLLSRRTVGLNLVIIDRQSLELRELATYTYNVEANGDALAQKLDSLDDSVFVCIVGCDHIGKLFTDQLISALGRLGSPPVNLDRTEGRYAFAFLGQKGLEPGYAYLSQPPTTASALDPLAEISAYVAGGAIMFQYSPSDGIGILSVENRYAVSASQTSAPTTGWSTTPPQVTATQRYLWNYEIITYTDQTTQETERRVIGVYGDTGKAGVGIEGITEYYLVSASASGVTTSTAGWSTAPQQTSAQKRYLWNYEVVRYTDGTSYTSTPVVIGTHGEQGDKGESGAIAKNLAGLVSDLDVMRTAEWEGRWYAGGGNGIAHRPDGVNAFGLDVSRTAQGWWSQILTPADALTNTQWMRAYGNGVWTAWVEKGKDGANGTPGTPGEDGRTPYVHFAYANSADGSVGFSTTDSAGKLYIGQYVDYTQADSTNPGMYSWTRIKGDQGPGALQMVIEGQTILPATGGTTTLKARLWQDGAEVDPSGTLFTYDWEIYVDGALYATKSGKQTTWMPGPTTWQTGEIRCTAREKS